MKRNLVVIYYGNPTCRLQWTINTTLGKRLVQLENWNSPNTDGIYFRYQNVSTSCIFFLTYLLNPLCSSRGIGLPPTVLFAICLAYWHSGRLHDVCRCADQIMERILCILYLLISPLFKSNRRISFWNWWRQGPLVSSKPPSESGV